MKKVLALLAVLSALVAVPRQAPPRRVVVIVIDTLRKDHLPFYGYARDTAPFLSRLAREGSVFDAAYSTSTWTAPASASIFASAYPFQHGVVTGFWATKRAQRKGFEITLNRLPAEIETLGEAMLGAGYATYAITDNVNLCRELGFAQGFQHFKNFVKTKSAEAVNRKLMDFRDQLAREKRYFLYLHYVDPHGPYEERAPWFDPSARGEAREISAYDSEIAYVDQKIAEAFSALGWDRDTLVIVTADHGEEFLDHNFKGHGHTLFSEVLDVPLLIWGPGRVPAGRRVATPVSHVDILPTLREAAAARPDPANQGLSLLPLLAGHALPERTLYAHLYRMNEEGGSDKHLRAALTAEWKLILGDSRGPRLYDLRSDRGDSRNLAQERPQVLQALTARLLEFERSGRKWSGGRAGFRLDEQAQEDLRALGYVN